MQVIFSDSSYGCNLDHSGPSSAVQHGERASNLSLWAAFRMDLQPGEGQNSSPSPSLGVSSHPPGQGVTNRRAPSVISEYLLHLIIFIFSPPPLSGCPKHTALSGAPASEAPRPPGESPGPGLAAQLPGAASASSGR